VDKWEGEREEAVQMCKGGKVKKWGKVKSSGLVNKWTGGRGGRKKSQWKGGKVGVSRPVHSLLALKYTRKV
jgi:hypothetical protein